MRLARRPTAARAAGAMSLAAFSTVPPPHCAGIMHSPRSLHRRLSWIAICGAGVALRVPMGAPYVVPWTVAVLSNSARNRLARAPRSGVNLFASSGDDGDASSEEKDSVLLSPEEYDAIPAGIRDDIEAGAPSQMTVMKEVGFMARLFLLECLAMHGHSTWYMYA